MATRPAEPPDRAVGPAAILFRPFDIVFELRAGRTVVWRA